MKQARTFKESGFLARKRLSSILLTAFVVKPRFLILMSRFGFTVRREQIIVGSGDDSALVLHYSQSPTEKKPAFILISGSSLHGGFYGLSNHLARALTFFGFHVFAPVFNNTKDCLLKQNSLEALKKIIKGVAELDIVEPNKIGLCGESFGSGMTLLTAEDSEINRNIRLILLFSPYATLEAAIHFAFSMKSTCNENQIVPDPYLRMLFALNTLDNINPSLDKAVLRQAFLNYLKDRYDWAIDDIRNIGKRERNFFLSVLRGTDVGEPIITTLCNDAEKLRNVLSPLTIQSNLEKPILIVHGITDNVINCDQSKILAEAITSSGGVTAHFSPILQHQQFFSFWSNPWRWIIGFSQLSEIFFKTLVYFQTYDLLKRPAQADQSNQ
ncbi:MAG: hypothetical protein PHW79_02415 [Candidatus Marinimicrobia bacterium]|nr:hypothetical protein [Candidatus Neomarinimicrobiota bacterium]